MSKSVLISDVDGVQRYGRVSKPKTSVELQEAFLRTKQTGSVEREYRSKTTSKKTVSPVVPEQAQAPVDVPNSDDQTRFDKAVFAGNVALMRTLIIGCGVDVNRPNSQEKTPFAVAVGNKDIEVIKELVKCSRFNLKAVDQEVLNAALHIVASSEDVSSADKVALMRKLIGAGVDVNRPNSKGETLFAVALRNEDIEVIKELVKCSRFNLKALGQEVLNAALHIVASSVGEVKLVGMLIDAGADVNSKNKNGKTAAHLALRMGNLRVFEVLAKCLRFDPNIKDNEGNTVLHLAVDSHDYNLVKEVLNISGINQTIQNFAGGAELDLEMVKLLLECAQLDSNGNYNRTVGDALQGDNMLSEVCEQWEKSIQFAPEKQGAAHLPPEDVVNDASGSDTPVLPAQQDIAYLGSGGEGVVDNSFGSDVGWDGLTEVCQRLRGDTQAWLPPLGVDGGVSDIETFNFYTQHILPKQ